MNTKKLDDIILECLCEVYTKTTPALDLKSLVDSGESKNLPPSWFDDYLIPEILFEGILGRWEEKYKLKGTDLKYFRTNMYLGPSPRFTPQNSSPGA